MDPVTHNTKRKDELNYSFYSTKEEVNQKAI